MLHQTRTLSSHWVRAVIVGCIYSLTTWAEPVHIDVSNGPAPFVSAYNLFKDVEQQIPNEGMLPYDINTPHFADYATLYRFLWLPPETQITYQPDHSLEYPLGAAVILTVAYPHNIKDPAQGQQLVETRLIIYTQDGWVAFQYKWDDTLTDAKLALAGGKKEVTWTHYDGEENNLDVYIPNRSQCAMCHANDGEFLPLGPMKARNLNRDMEYPEGKENQLAHWLRTGLLKGLPEDPAAIPTLPVWNNPSTGTVNERARAYLEMNCSSCHQPGGLAWTSGLDLRFEQDNPVRFGVYKAPVAAGRGVGKGYYGIEPGNPEKSMLYHRLASTDPGIRMPVVGRGLVHEEGIALIHEWITAMDYPELSQAEKEDPYSRQTPQQAPLSTY